MLGRGLDAGDLLPDLAGSLRGLFGECLDLGGDDSKAATGFAGARGLDGRVERQEIGLTRDGVDQLDHVADPRRRSGQFADTLGGDTRLATASLATRADSCTCLLISVIEDDSSSVADATACTLVDASSEAAATMVVSCCPRSAVDVSVEAEASSSVAAEDTVSTISPIAASKPSASFRISALRCSSARRSAAA